MPPTDDLSREELIELIAAQQQTITTLTGRVAELERSMGIQAR